MEIIDQKRLADSLLRELRQTFTGPVRLYGGAPRNWYFNKKANDLDFYLCHRGCSVEALEQMFKAKLLGTGPVPPGFFRNLPFFTSYEEDDTKYNSGEGLEEVLEAHYQGMKINFMLVNWGRYCMSECFDNSLCMIEWDSFYVPTEEFMLSVETKVMFLNRYRSLQSKHTEKIDRKSVV